MSDEEVAPGQSRRRQATGMFDGLYGRTMLRALASMCDTSTECWIWTGAFTGDGKGGVAYPALSMRVGGARRVMKAHRVAYEHAYGPIPSGEQVHHRCSDRRCVRPEHLEAATARLNIAEMLVRRALEQRIRDLEAALRSFQPDHEAIAQAEPDS